MRWHFQEACGHAVLILAFWAVSIAAKSPDVQYKGCFLDEVKVTRRAMPYGQMINESMTIERCVGICDEAGFPWAGLQYVSECYCSKREPLYGKIPEEKCNKPCGGDSSEICGGAYALSTYYHAGIKPPVDKRPLIALVMILKDEAHTIIDTLKTVRHVVDRWYILDTGSKDGTQKLVQDFMKHIPGRVFEEPFKDYGATRNRILDLARESEECVFTLMLSADERVENPDEMRTFLEDMRHSVGKQHNAYPVRMDSGVEFDSVRIARMSGMWRYVGRVHEYLTSPEKQWVDLYRPVPEVRVRFRATDEPRRFQSQYNILRVLLEDLQTNPNDTRALFYVARTYSTVKNHTESYRYFELLANRSKWNEEVYFAKVMKAEEARTLQTPWQHRQELLLDAFLYKPNSMDALHMLAEDHFNEGRFHLAYLYALRAAQIPMPENLKATQSVLLRDTEYLYKWEGDRLLGFSAEKVDEFAVCVDSLRRVMKTRPDDTYAERVLRNCETKLNLKPGEALLGPNVVRLHQLQQQRVVAREQELQRDLAAKRTLETQKEQLRQGMPAPYQPLVADADNPSAADQFGVVGAVGSAVLKRQRENVWEEPIVVLLCVAVAILMVALRREKVKRRD